MDLIKSNGVMLILMGTLFLVNFILIIVLLTKFRKLNRTQTKVNKILGDESVDEYFINCVKRQDKLERLIKELEIETLKMDDKQKKSFDHVGLVRYSASDDSQAKLSYSLGVTNSAKDGFVITGLHYRQGINIYVKSINDGVSDIPLSKEEKEALSY